MLLFLIYSILYTSSIDCLTKTIKNEGFWSLYKGFLPIWMRMAPWSLSFWLTYEEINRVLVQVDKTKSKLKQCVLQRVSILQWLPTYTKMDMTADFIAGITVGLTMMPQSIAYAALADLPSQYGLYTAFIGSFTYIFFGTIKEVSIGPTSILALMSFTYTEGLPIDYMILLCFLSGCVELLMGLLKLGFMVDFISAPVVSGFTSAMSVIIIGTQMKGLLGIRFKNHGFFDLLVKLCQHITDLKIADTILGICCIVFLLAFKKLTSIPVKNPSIKKMLWFVSIGRNALIVLITSCVGYYYHVHGGGAPFRITGTVPSGLPEVKPPPFSTILNNERQGFFEMIQTLGSGIVVVPMLAVLANVAIAKSFTSGTVVDATQEMITLGLCNILGSFVQAMPTCGAFTRSAVSNASGVRTPLQGLYSGSIILLSLSFLTPYFYYIPRSTLSAVLMSAVVTLIDYESLPKFWKCRKFDFILTIITFVISILYGVEVGLLTGVAINVLSLLKLWTRPKIISEICMNEKGQEYILIKPELGLYFPAVDYLNQEVVKICIKPEVESLPVVVDFTNILAVDYAACQGLNTLIKIFNKKQRKIVLQSVNPDVFKILKTVLQDDKLHFCQSTEDLCIKVFESKNESDTPLLMDKNNYINNLPHYDNV